MKNKILLEACLNNQIQKVEERICCGDRLDEFSGDSSPALSISCYFGYHDISRLLIENGAQINTKDKNWMTPLHYSAMASSSDSIRLLLNLNADPLIRSKLWHTPIHIAAQINNLECLELIASKMKMINVTDRMGWNALHHAAYKGCVDNARYLINKGIHPKHTDKKERTPLHYAALSGAFDLVSILIESGAPVNARDKMGFTPLHFAAMKSNTHICKELVKFGANLFCQSNVGNVPLHISCFLGDIETIDFFADAMDNSLIHPNNNKQIYAHLSCFPVNSYLFMSRFLREELISAKDDSGRSILHYLAYNGNLAGLCCLSDHKFDINEKDSEGWTALHMACYKDELEMAIRLIRMNADVSCRTNDGRTPLHFAALSKNEILVKCLLDQGANKELVDTLMRTPLHYSIFSMNLDITSLLLEPKDYGIKDLHGRNLLHYAILSFNPEFIELVISNGIHIDSIDDEGRTPLHYASFFDEEGQIVNTLLDCSSTSLKDIHGFLPLHYAFYGNKILNISTLLEKTCEIITETSPCISLLHISLQIGLTEFLPTILKRYDCTHIPFDDDEISPFHLAAAKGEIKPLNILLQFFGNINICTQEKIHGYTPVHLAASISNIDCLKALVEHSSNPQDLNTTNKDSLTALSISVLNKSSEALIRYLVKKGSLLNIPFSPYLISLIHVACIRGNSSILDFFLKSGADSDQITENRKSGALLCAQVGSLLCLKVLHKYEANLNLLDTDMYSPLQWACIKGNTDIVDFLLQNIFPEEVFHGAIFSSLHCAVFNQSIHSVNAILEMKREIPLLFDSYLRTPLHYAVSLDEPFIVESLLNSGASLSIKNSIGETPIHIAAVNNNRMILDLCLSHPCDLSIVDEDGNTALHLACLGGHKENAALLASKMTETQILIKNKQGETAGYFSQKPQLICEDSNS